MEDDKELADNDTTEVLTGSIAANIPVILTLPAMNAPSNGPQPRAPYRINTGMEQPEVPDEGEEQIWDAEHLMPLVNIISTMRRGLPEDAGLPMDVASIVQRATSDFILLVTSQAKERCKQEGRQKIKVDDFIWALEKLGFTDYVRPLELYYSLYQQHIVTSTDHGNRETSSSMAVAFRPPQEQEQEQFSGASTSHGSLPNK